jgi:hypothetical protein
MFSSDFLEYYLEHFPDQVRLRQEQTTSDHPTLEHFPDQVRLLQEQTTSDHHTSPPAEFTTGESGSFNVLAGMCFLAIMLVLMVIFGSYNMYRNCHAVPSSTRRTENVTDALELQLRGGGKPRFAFNSTLAQRTQALLELFETSQVTMVSNDYTMKSARKRRKLTISQSV